MANTQTIIVYVSGLVPTEGANVYNGIRLSVFATERRAYQDLAEWLVEGKDEPELDPETATNAEIAEALSNSDEVQSWTVEPQTIFDVPFNAAKKEENDESAETV